MSSSRKRHAKKSADEAIKEDNAADVVVDVDIGSEENAMEDEKAQSPPTKKRRGRSQTKKTMKQPTKHIANGESVEEIKTKEEDCLVCPYCNKKFSSENGLEYHLKKKVCQKAKGNLEKELACPHCDKLFTTEKRLANHVEKKVCHRRSSAYNSKEITKDDSPPTMIGESKRPTRRRRNTTNLTPAKRSSSPPSASEAEKDDLYTDDGGEDSDEDFEFEDVKPKKKRGNKGKRKSAPATAMSSSSRSNTNKKFYELKKGQCFITNYGIVEVIADDRLPAHHHTSTIDANAKRAYHKRLERFREKETVVRDQIAAGTRHRREKLKNLYMKSKGTAGTNSSTQAKVWELYSNDLTPTQILEEGLSSTCSIDLKGKKVDTFQYEDPRCPKDYYSDRIVKCKLVEDEREIIVGNLIGGDACDDSDNGGKSSVEFHVKERLSSNHTNRIVPMHFFIARRDLIREYDASKPICVCGNCGKDYAHREGVKYHISIRACTSKKECEKEIREQRIAEIESKALSDPGGCRNNLLASLHGVIKETQTKVADNPASFGNPHKIKEHKKHKMPPWLVFNDDRSSMYPEIYVALGFKRGSQNRNYFSKIKQDDGYIPRSEKKRVRKRMRKRMADPGAKPMPTLSTQTSTTNITICTSIITNKPGAKTTEPTKASEEKKKRPSKKNKSEDSDLLPNPPALPPLPFIANPDAMDVDFGYDGGNDDLIFDSTSDPTLLGGVSTHDDLNRSKKNGRNIKKAAGSASSPSFVSDDKSSKKSTSTAATSVPKNKRTGKKTESTSASSNQASASTSKSRRKKGISIDKKKDCVVIDTQVLAAECESGRYPSIKRFYGEHGMLCTLCKKIEDTTPLINCDFCKNSVHQLCIDKKMLLKDPQVIIRENEPDDKPMCHECISTCLFRRWRAENRRVVKWQHELAKAGLGNVPEAAGLTEEVNLKSDIASEIQSGGDDAPTYNPCPDGGPGGLICCSYCTATYSRFLSNTAKEMEAQSVSRVGKEVSEILELLSDAKERLQRASDVSQSNENRRGLLDSNQTAHSGMSL